MKPTTYAVLCDDLHQFKRWLENKVRPEGYRFPVVTLPSDNLIAYAENGDVYRAIWNEYQAKGYEFDEMIDIRSKKVDLADLVKPMVGRRKAAVAEVCSIEARSIEGKVEIKFGHAQYSGFLGSGVVSYIVTLETRQALSLIKMLAHQIPA